MKKCNSFFLKDLLMHIIFENCTMSHIVRHLIMHLPSNCLMRLWKPSLSPSNPCIVRSFERWGLWNSLYYERKSLYNRSKSSTVIPSQSLTDSSSSWSSSCSTIATIIYRAQSPESVDCT
jgi:hypothetical protein